VQEAQNQTFMFSNLHEKILRAQLLIKLLQLTSGPTTAPAVATTSAAAAVSNALADPTEGVSRAELWEQARLNLVYCREVSVKHALHGILLQTALLMKDLSEVASLAADGENAAESVRADAAVVEALLADGTQLYDVSLAYIQVHCEDSVDIVAAMTAVL
jgi:hypothetical protein